MKENNKKTLAITLTAGTLLFPALCFASWWGFDEEEKAGKNWAVNIGTRVWVNEWETNARGYNNNTLFVTTDTVDHNGQLSSKSVEATPIPTVSLRYGRFFFTGSHYSQTSFQFDDTNGYARTAPVQVPRYTFYSSSTWIARSEGKRNEWDGSIGYYIIPNLAFTVGYKEINMNMTTQVNGNSTSYHNWIVYETFLGSRMVTAHNKFSGPILGFNASLPFGDTGFGLYGAYVHGWLDWDFKSDVITQGAGVTNRSQTTANTTADYDLVELGINYIYNTKANSITANLPLTAAGVFAGYRFQRLKYNINETTIWNGKLLPPNSVQKATDTTQGFAVGVNFSF